MFNTDKKSYFSSMDKYGVQISAMGDIMIDEIMMMRLQEMVGLDIRESISVDGDSFDGDKVLKNAKSSGFIDLGSFGGRTHAHESNSIFYMSNEKIEMQKEVNELVKKAIEVGNSYMELGYYLEDKTYKISVEYSMLETVKVTAKSEQEAIDTFLNDIASYSELGKLAESDYYNGVSNIVVKSEEENFLD